MRIVQYESGGARGCGVERDGAVFATPYTDTLTLIRDGEQGLEAAAAAAERSDPVPVDRLLAPLTNPGRSSAPASTTEATATRSPASSFPDEVVWDFIKVASAIIGPGRGDRHPAGRRVICARPAVPAQFAEHGFAVDYEVEFGVVIGSRAKNVAPGGCPGPRLRLHRLQRRRLALASSSTTASATSARTSTPSARWARASSPRTSCPTGRPSGSSPTSTASCGRTPSSASRSARLRWRSSGSARSSRSSPATA